MVVNEQFSFILGVFLLFLHIKIFLKTYSFLKKSQFWSREKIEKYQLEQLKKLLVHSYENVPYYHKLFDKIGFKPYDFKDFEDLQKIPFLTNEIIRNNLEDLKAQDYPDYKFGYMTTGGTTGSPLGIYVEKNVSFIKEVAFLKIFLDGMGLNLYDKSVVLRGNVVISESDKGKFWKYSLFHRLLILSSYHMNDENLPKYVEKIRRFKPKYISAYPSSLCILAKYMKKNKIKPFKSLKTIICGSETLYTWQKILIEDTFQCKMYETYGHTEQTVIAHTCKKSNFFHFSPEYGFVEFIDRYGGPVNKENDVCEIVATGFKNDIFPFIRYKTNDYCIYTSIKCSCGRNHSLAKVIVGRSSSDFLISKDNSLVTITAMNMHSDIFDNVKQFQFYQEKKGEVIFRIVKIDSYTDRDANSIRQELLKKLGNDFKLKIEYVEKISRTPRGKQNFLIQKLNVNIRD